MTGRDNGASGTAEKLPFIPRRVRPPEVDPMAPALVDEIFAPADIDRDWLLEAYRVLSTRLSLEPDVVRLAGVAPFQVDPDAALAIHKRLAVREVEEVVRVDA